MLVVVIVAVAARAATKYNIFFIVISFLFEFLFALCLFGCKSTKNSLNEGTDGGTIFAKNVEKGAEWMEWIEFGAKIQLFSDTAKFGGVIRKCLEYAFRLKVVKLPYS